MKVYCDQKLVWGSSALFPLSDLTVCFLLLTSLLPFFDSFTCYLWFKTLAHFIYSQLVPFLFYGVQETSPDLRIWLLANLEEFFKFIISNVLSLSIYCQSFPSPTFVVSFRFILLIFMPFCLAKLVFRGLHHFEENFLRVTGWYGSNSGDSLRKLSDSVVSPQNLLDPPENSLILLWSLPSAVHWQSIFPKVPLLFAIFYWRQLIFPSVPQKTIRSSIVLRTPPPRRKMMTSSQVSVSAIYTYTERSLSRQTRPCSLLSDHICR